VPTLASDAATRSFATTIGSTDRALAGRRCGGYRAERCEGRCLPTVQAIVGDGRTGRVQTVEESLAASVRHIMPMEQAEKIQRKYATHRLTVLTWAVCKTVLKDLLPMSTDLLCAFIWDALDFETTISVLKHCVNAIKAWHRRLGMPVPADEPGEYRRLTNSLARFQGTQLRLIFSLHACAVRRLLLLPVPVHGASGGCDFCRLFLHQWRVCLLGAVATLTCSRCAEARALQSCDLYVDYDLEAGHRRWAGGSAVNVKIRKNDQFRQGHQLRLGVPHDPRLHVVRQLMAFMRAVGNGL
jgi:hypothetical protein